MHPLRRRLENSEFLAELIGRLAAGYLRFCMATIRWTDSGVDELRASLNDGPVIVVMWHSRILLGPAHLSRIVPLITLRDPSPAGRVSAAMQRRFGMEPVSMSGSASNTAASRGILKQLKGGRSIGLTADGPLGPARVMKDAPLDWARVARVPVFMFAYSCTRQRRLGTWDNMLVPRPFGRGHMGLAKWEKDLPRRADAETLAGLRHELADSVNALQAQVDAELGLEPGP